MNYKKGNNVLKGRCKDGKKIGNNTYLERKTKKHYIAKAGTGLYDVILKNVIVVRLHETDIIRFYEGGDIILTTNGWQTVTTKARLNEHLEVGFIRQEKFAWYLYIDDKQYVYQDEMKIRKDKKVLYKYANGKYKAKYNHDYWGQK